MKIEYTPRGVCSKKMVIDIEDNIITDVRVIGGCPGNTLGVSVLLKGMSVKEAIDKLEGIRCRQKPTSCPDQIAQALKTI